jgi:hypothetical protein
VARSEIATYGSAFWERANKLFSLTRPRSDEPDEQPSHRGFVIAMCIIFSTMLWFFSSLGETYTKTIEMRTHVENLGPDEAFVSLPPRVVQAQVNGDGLQLMRLHSRPPQILIDASVEQINLQDAVQRYLPQSIRLERVLPPLFIPNKEPRITRTIPIHPRVAISWPPTHDEVQAPSVYPDSVTVTGAQSIIEGLNAWATEKFEYDDLKDTLRVMIQLADSLEGLVELSLQETQLMAVTEPFTEGIRDLEVHILEVPFTQETLTLDPPNIQVRYRVPLSQYQRAQDASDFLASVDYDTIRDDTTGYVKPNLELPQGIHFRDVDIFPSELRYYDILVDE